MPPGVGQVIAEDNEFVKYNTVVEGQVPVVPLLARDWADNFVTPTTNPSL
jgi:hypothetical protein